MKNAGEITLSSTRQDKHLIYFVILDFANVPSALDETPPHTFHKNLPSRNYPRDNEKNAKKTRDTRSQKLVQLPRDNYVSLRELVSLIDLSRINSRLLDGLGIEIRIYEVETDRGRCKRRHVRVVIA